MSSDCALLSKNSTREAIANLAYSAYFWIKPICLIFDLIGHTLCFIAFYKQSKTLGSIYAFQFYESVARTIDSLAAGLDLIVFQWCAGLNYEGVHWFQKSYFLMWWAAHISIPLNDATTTVALFVSLAMSVDRTLAIGKPMRYKQLNRKKWEIGWIVFSVLIGVSASIFVYFYFIVVWDDEKGLYVVIGHPTFGSSSLATVLANIRNTVWITGLIGIAGTGSCLVYLYKSRNKKVAHLTGSKGENFKEKLRRKAEKTLFALTVFDTVQAVNEITILIVHTMLASRDGFFACEGQLFAAFRNIEIALVNASDFYVMLFVSKAFREMIKQALSGKSDVDGSSAVVLHT